MNLQSPVDGEQLRRMTDLIAHRGPDDSGQYLRARVGLGHRRLSIIDRAGGRQPLANEDDTVWIVFNGEIYNYRSLRDELRAAGHRFRTQSDTEVIVHAYEEWGEACARHLRGMFAFAIWDERRERLTLVRDRLGIKPIYYARSGGDLLFASEIKSLLLAPEIDRSIDEEALAAYLALRYVPAPATLFRGVRKLPPASTLTWRRGLVHLHQYWDLAELPEAAAPLGTEVEEALALRDEIDEVTEMRLMSEVPVGAFLSGGLDSTFITASMLRARGRGASGPLKTFSVGYAGAGTQSEDELDAARLASQALGTEHREVRVTMADAARALPAIVWHLDEPVADAACVPLYFLSRRAREEVTVVLSGEGADEIFGGYNIYRLRALALRLRATSGAGAALIAAALARLPWNRARRMGRLLGRPGPYHGVSRAFDEEGTFALHRRPALQLASSQLGSSIDRAGPTRWSPLRQMLYFDTRVWLPDDLLVKADKMTMAHAIELRVPFLDHHLVERAWAMPDRFKLGRFSGPGKSILRAAAIGRVPQAVLDRPKKGFGTPTAAWLRGGLRDLLHDALFSTCSLTRERFDLRYVDRLISDHEAGADRSSELWALLVLELWHDAFSAPAARSTPVLAAPPLEARHG